MKPLYSDYMYPIPVVVFVLRHGRPPAIAATLREAILFGSHSQFLSCAACDTVIILVDGVLWRYADPSFGCEYGV